MLGLKKDIERDEILCVTGAFHGRTLAMLAANDRPLFEKVLVLKFQDLVMLSGAILKI